MRIYFIGQKGIPAVTGGVEQYVDNLSTRLAKEGHEVFVYARWNYTDRKRTKYRGVNLINLPSIPTKNLDAISHTLLATAHVLFQRADIIHYHSIGPASLLWLPQLLKRRTAVVATFQSQCYRHKKWGAFARWYLRLGERTLCLLSDAVIVPSLILFSYVKRRYGRAAFYLPNGITMPQAKRAAAISRRWKLNKGGYILAVSRLVRHKGLHYLIAAYQKLNTGKKLVIVGDGAFTDDYVAELKLSAKNNPNIIFTGRQSGSILAELYDNAYLFVQPSETEGQSIALLEAMSYGLAVLTSDIEENYEVIADSGSTFINRSAADLRRKLSYLLRRPDICAHYGKLARIRVNNFYNWDALVSRVIAVYNQARREKIMSLQNINLAKDFNTKIVK